MSSPVVTIGPDRPICEAARLMLDHRVSGLPVVDAGGRLVGIVSERDLLRRRVPGSLAEQPKQGFVIPLGAWLRGLLARSHPNTVVVALAAKMARIVWALLRHERTYEPVALAA